MDFLKGVGSHCLRSVSSIPGKLGDLGNGIVNVAGVAMKAIPAFGLVSTATALTASRVGLYPAGIPLISIATGTLAGIVASKSLSHSVPDVCVEESIPDYGDLVIPRGREMIIIPLKPKDKTELHALVREIEIAAKKELLLVEGEKITHFQVESFKKRSISFQREKVDPDTSIASLGPVEEYSLRGESSEEAFQKIIAFYDKMLQQNEAQSLGAAIGARTGGHVIEVHFDSKTFSEYDQCGALVSEGNRIPNEYLFRFLENKNSVRYLSTPPLQKESCFVSQMIASPGVFHPISQFKEKEERRKEEEKTYLTRDRYKSKIPYYGKKEDALQESLTRKKQLVERRVTSLRDTITTGKGFSDKEAQIRASEECINEPDDDTREVIVQKALGQYIEEQMADAKGLPELLNYLPLLSEIVDFVGAGRSMKECYEYFCNRYKNERGYDLQEDKQMVLDLMGFVWTERGEYEAFVKGEGGIVRKTFEGEMKAFQEALELPSKSAGGAASPASPAG